LVNIKLKILSFLFSRRSYCIPHVQMVLPNRALSIQVIEDRTPSDDIQGSQL